MVGAPVVSVRDGYTVVDIPVALEHADGIGRVILDADRQVAGFFVRPRPRSSRERRPPQLSPYRLLAGLLLPLAGYLVIRAAIGSATGALAITEAIPATWLLVAGIARRRLDPVAVMSTVTVAIALAAYALTGGDPLALKLRRGAVTGTLGIAALASVALGRPLLLMLAEHIAKLNPERQPEIEARLADPDTASSGDDSHRDRRAHVHDRRHQPDRARADRPDRDVRRRLDGRADHRSRHRPDRHDLVPPPPKGAARQSPLIRPGPVRRPVMSTVVHAGSSTPVNDEQLSSSS